MYKNFNKILISTVIGLLIILFVASVYFLIRNYISKSTTNINDIKKYLRNVYPAISFSGVNEQNIIELYNNLGWYYQCCNVPNGFLDKNDNPIINTIIPKSPDGTISSIQNWPVQNWNAIGCCEDKPIPLIPNGIYYDWYSWQYFGVPIITIKDGKWGYSSFTNENVYFSDPENTRGGIDSFVSQPVSNYPATNNFSLSTKKNSVSRGTKPGPSCFYAGSRNLVKYPYYPYGLQFIKSSNQSEGEWVLNGHKITDHKYMFGHTLSSQTMKQNMLYSLGQDDKTYWIDGYPKGSYIEVGHVGHSPTGLPDSTGFWINHYPPKGGTGLFYEIGKSPVMLNPEGGLEGVEGHSPRNKVGMLLTLLFEIYESTTLPNVGCGLADKNKKRQYFKNGKKLLEHLYGTSDPYQIVFYHCVGYYDDIINDGGRVTRRPLENYAMSSNGYPFCNTSSWAVKNSFLPEGSVGNAFASTGTFIDPAQPSGQGNQLIYINNLSYQVYCYYVLLTYYDGNIPTEMLDSSDGYWNYFSVDGTNPVFYNKDEKGKPDSIKLSRQGRKHVIDLACQSNWYFDRVADGVAFDEPMHYFGSILNYDSLQMTADPTANGLWGYEIIDIRWPEDHLPRFFEDNGKTYPDPYWSGWKERAISDRQWALAWWDVKNNSAIIPISISTGYVAMLMNVFISHRNPFDPNDDKSIKKCTSSGGFKCNTGGNIKCNKISSELREFVNKQGINPNKFLSPAVCSTEDLNSVKSYRNIQEQLSNNTQSKSVSNFVVMDEDNDLCYPLWANNIPDTANIGSSLSSANTFGHMYCQTSNEFPYSAFWGNVDYNTGAERPNNNPEINNVNCTLPHGNFE